MESDEQQAPSIHAQLETKRKTLPAWFPKTVWDDVERKVEAIHYADVVYPVYAKYMSRDQADLWMLLYAGPTGQKIAAFIKGKGETMASSSLRGSAADQELSNRYRNDADFQTLLKQRFSEMTPEEQERLRAALPEMRANNLKIDDAAHQAYFARTNDVVRQTIAQHQTELVKAQQQAGH